MRGISFAILAMVLLSACGTKGPLYIPEQKYPQDPAQKSQTPSPKLPRGDVVN